MSRLISCRSWSGLYLRSRQSGKSAGGKTYLRSIERADEAVLVRSIPNTNPRNPSNPWLNSKQSQPAIEDLILSAEGIALRTVFMVFISIFLAELGDKTQLATFLFATDPNLSRTAVFAASSLALVLSSLLAVVLGSQISHFVSPNKLRVGAGIGFIVIGIWFLATARS